jgi:hypothetical protein
MQMGVDDVMHPWFKEEQLHQSRRVLSAQSAAACRAAARYGVPHSERPSIWACALGLKLDPSPPPDSSSSSGAYAVAAAGSSGSSGGGAGTSSSLRVSWSKPSQRDEEVLALLCESVQRQQLLVDTLVCADVQHVVDSEDYFVFEETLRWGTKRRPRKQDMALTFTLSMIATWLVTDGLKCKDRIFLNSLGDIWTFLRGRLASDRERHSCG